MRYLFILPLLFIGFTAAAQQQQEKKEMSATMKVGDYEVYVMPDSRPEFKGGNKGLMEYVKKNTAYPESARKDSVEGQVIVRFIVDEKGQVQAASVMRPLHDDLDKVAIELVNKMPRWQPAMKGGKPVAVQHMIPVRFVLPKE